MSSIVPERPMPERLHPANNTSSWLVIGLSVLVLLLFGACMVKRLVDCPNGIRADFVQEWTSAKNFWSAIHLRTLTLIQTVRPAGAAHRS